MPINLAGLIVARNEAHQLGACVASLTGLPTWVVDHESTDATAAVAAAAGARVVPGRGTLSELRALGTAQVEAEWILWLDADERLPPGALPQVMAAIEHAAPQVAAFRLRIATYLGDRPLRFGGYRPRRIRLYRRAAVTWPPARVHERPVLAGRCADLPLCLEHRCYRSWAHALEKTRRYAAWGALDLQARGRRPSAAAAMLRAGWRWIRVAILQGGCLMGRLGLRLAGLQAAGVYWRLRWARTGLPAGVDDRP